MRRLVTTCSSNPPEGMSVPRNSVYSAARRICNFRTGAQLAPLNSALELPPVESLEQRMNMKRAEKFVRRIGLLAVLAGTITATSAWAQNYNQIALLKWYQANQTTGFAVDGNLSDVAFDGSSIWVTDQSHSVTKLDASTGMVLGTFRVGRTPLGLAFDGANIWVANAGDGTVSKLRASDGTALGTFTVGIFPWGVAFDGANIWVTNSKGNNVTKLRASDGFRLGAFDVGVSPHGLAFDGTNMWVANFDGKSVMKLSSSGEILVTYNNIFGADYLAFDGSSMWASGLISNKVFKLALNGSGMVGYDVRQPEGMAFDGANLWIAGHTGSVTELRVSDGTILASFSAGMLPVGVAFDGANIWVACMGQVRKM